MKTLQSIFGYALLLLAIYAFHYFVVDPKLNQLMEDGSFAQGFISTLLQTIENHFSRKAISVVILAIEFVFTHIIIFARSMMMVFSQTTSRSVKNRIPTSNNESVNPISPFDSWC